PPVGRAKSEAVLLKTWPVGLPPGMVTTSPWGTPAPLYSVDLPVTWSETQNGLVGEKETPQGFFRLGWRWGARPGMSETRLFWTNPARPAPGTARVMRPPSSAHSATRTLGRCVMSALRVFGGSPARWGTPSLLLPASGGSNGRKG